MLKLALCEDDPIFSESQEQLCREVLQTLGWKADLTVYLSAEDLLTDWENGIRYDVLLLDILMEEMDGITLARRLRTLESEASIVFITSSPSFALQGYDVDALHYLMKPLTSEALTQVLQKDHAKRHEQKKVCFTIGAHMVCENLEDIVYLETKGRYVDVVLKHKTLTVHGKLADLLGNLPSKLFLRCHQGFAVNAVHVQEMNVRSALLHGGHCIPIGRTYKKEFRDAFLGWLGQ